MPKNLKTVGNLTVKDSLQDFDAKEMYLHPRINQSRSKSMEICSVFNILSVHTVPFQKCAAYRVPFFKI